MLNRDLDQFADLFWGPWSDFNRVQSDLGRLFDGFAGTTRTYPAINIWTGEEGVILRAELPGFDTESLDLSIHGKTLTLKGQRQTVGKEEENRRYHRRERKSGEFIRTVALPYTVENDEVSAHFENGILEVKLPRAKAELPRKIEVRSA